MCTGGPQAVGEESGVRYLVDPQSSDAQKTSSQETKKQVLRTCNDVLVVALCRTNSALHHRAIAGSHLLKGTCGAVGIKEYLGHLMIDL